VRFVSAGAAHGLVAAVAREAGIEVEGSFGAVGAQLERFLAGEACDVVILAKAQVAKLAAEGRVIAQACADLGSVPTSIAVREGSPVPDVSRDSGLREALLAADAIYFPDPTKATAGIHFAKVIDQLGVRDRVAARLRTFPNGSTAMREMAAAGGNPVGCTQSTEILATPGVRLVGPLPPGCELVTIYTAAVKADAGDVKAARDFVARLSGEATRAQRKKAGFG
jgi:molybdate transport system substrate-binding protein